MLELKQDSQRINLRLAIAIFVALIGIFLLGGFIINTVYYSTPTPRSELERELVRFRSQVAEQPNDAGARVGLAQSYYRIGQTSRAIAELKAARKLDPKLWDALFELGLIYLDQKKTSEATKLFLQAAKADPKNELSYYQLGLIYLEGGENDLAIRNLNRAVELKPIMADAHYSLGLAYERQKQTESAAAHYREALRYVPDMAAAQKALRRINANERI